MKKVFIVVLFICMANIANAQFQLNRLTFGGGFGFQFGDYTSINLSPQVGYNFSKYITAGAGVSYSYYNEKYNHKQWKYTNHYFGFNVYGRLYPTSFLVLMLQPEANRMWRTNENLQTKEKFKTEKFVPSCLIGGGFRVGPMTAMIQYDIAQNNDSPYGNNMFYSIGYTFGF